MNNRVDYLSDKLVHARERIKARQQALTAGRGGNPPDAASAAESPAPQAPEMADPVPDNTPPPAVEAARPADVPSAPFPAADAAGKQQAFDRRYDQPLQLRRDLEQRLIRCVTQAEGRLAEAETLCSQLTELSARLDARMAALRELELPEAGDLSIIELGDLYRGIDRERLEFFQLEAQIERLDRGIPVPGQAHHAPPGPADFKQAFKIGLGFTLPLILGLGGAILLGALLLFLSWR